MKKSLFLLALVIASCSSIKSHNEHLNDMIPVEKLQQDVDFAYNKLQKMHPKLYWYISKEKLDFKFDSLKKTIDKPMTSLDFYKKIAPVVCAVREGHTFVYPSVKQYTKSEIKAITKRGPNPVSQLNFEIFNDKLYVVKNKSKDKTIKIGSEVLSINDENPLAIIAEYDKYFTSDGYNKTMKKNFLGKRFGTFYGFKNGVKDSLKYSLKFKDSIKCVTIRRKSPDSTNINKKIVKTEPKKELTADEIAIKKAKAKALKINKKIFGYDAVAKEYNRNLKFMQIDSSVAVMTIKHFAIGNYSKFYEESFEKISHYKSKSLIIDLRDNGGGRLSEINELYSYLADSTYTFLDNSEVTSKNSLFKYAYLKGGSPLVKTAKIAATPLLYPISLLLTKKDSNGNYYGNYYNKPQEIKATAFKGKIFVLINGGSFSASSIISSNLKGSKRATFVGQETGGAYNGTVAGIMPTVKLPNSNVRIKIGIMTCIPHYKTAIEGRGIMPDKEIIPTIEDRINKKDPEMGWVLKEIGSIQ
jgi:C-terminal processing protease CtpA/Prc